MTSNGIVIAGGGLAGQRCAETLRRHGYDAPIKIVCAETHRPYDRPPLSKERLHGRHEVAYRPADWYEQHAIELLLGIRASELRPRERRLVLSDGRALRYDWLLIATGARPRALPILDGYPNVSVLRTLDDADALREALGTAQRLAVIGGGFIGQEVAAAARARGCEVTIVEAAPRPLHSILGAPLGDWFSDFHRAHGVTVLTDATVQRINANGLVQGLELSTGARVATDHVVVGVGIDPAIEWLAGTPLHAPGGIPADPHGRTAVERVLAAGDAAATFDRRLGTFVPGSHWEAAGRQGARAARVMLGLDPGTAPLTSFWTDQYGIRIQYLGHARLADSLQIDGDPISHNFTVTYTRAGQPVAALLVGRPRVLAAARKSIEEGIT